MKFSISRYDPDHDDKPYLRHYDIDILPSDRMLLDVLLRIKSQDPPCRCANPAVKACAAPTP